ncbi:50S ribosomal protein L33 [Candidatus Woesebacteria bacterium RBG_19FT_COMBO_47_8]|uniref:Large ribosomal subunit protein bL33 n=1 Tax=Candidatus Woesebacteria bacterium RBG_13_46_13 TaxID=1802479 RepID=A0A1F7X4C1_9BACT|nr:MAG: 50S ribosomal protein L33 [Candidatus Woesebacteria bacterium RBG_13_46_13]OGM17186.1 MAG: 50S ribosomal protein L33 [Candidatus Woesebacteria bacterium RBG_19FT_COMBO_47_8]HJX59452.1 50S ribosomal protein L33 [Patescibacteria group bacterium]
MAKKGAREHVALLCSVCKNQNYLTERNKINMEEKKLLLNKYCRTCRKVTPHKESSKLK